MGSSNIIIDLGRNTLFWYDISCGDSSFRNKYSKLFDLAVNRNGSVQYMLGINNDSLRRLSYFRRNLIVVLVCQWKDFLAEISQIHLSLDHDRRFCH